MEVNCIYVYIGSSSESKHTAKVVSSHAFKFVGCSIYYKFNIPALNCTNFVEFLGESVTSGLSWAQVAEYVGTRSEKQCRTKWLNYLNWKQKGGAEWTREDDLLMLNK